MELLEVFVPGLGVGGVVAVVFPVACGAVGVVFVVVLYEWEDSAGVCGHGVLISCWVVTVFVVVLYPALHHLQILWPVP